jgi:hypothetical protein
MNRVGMLVDGSHTGCRTIRGILGLSFLRVARQVWK